VSPVTLDSNIHVADAQLRRHLREQRAAARPSTLVPTATVSAADRHRHRRQTAIGRAFERSVQDSLALPTLVRDETALDRALHRTIGQLRVVQAQRLDQDHGACPCRRV
jgi:hypothetical protein